MLTQWLSAVSELPILPPAAYRRLLEAVDEAVVALDHRGRVLAVNAAAERLLRRLCPEPPATFIGSALVEVIGSVPWPSGTPAPWLAGPPGPGPAPWPPGAPAPRPTRRAALTPWSGPGLAPTQWPVSAPAVPDTGPDRPPAPAPAAEPEAAPVAEPATGPAPPAAAGPAGKAAAGAAGKAAAGAAADPGTGAEQVLFDVRGSGIDLAIRVRPLHGGDGRDIGWAVVARDITGLYRQRTELEHATGRLHDQARTIESLRADLTEQAIHDHLTGLYNRRHLISELAAAVQYASAARSDLSLAVLDIDHFRNINGQYGVAVGDGVLAHIATMISGAILPGEVVARHGGQEFALMLPGVAAARAAAYVDALRQLIGSGDLLVQGCAVKATFSAGVTGFTGGEQPDDLLAAADAALYAAKQGGRNRVQLATTRPLEQPTATVTARRAAMVTPPPPVPHTGRANGQRSTPDRRLAPPPAVRSRVR